MRDSETGNEKPNVIGRKYLTTDEVHRLIGAAGKVGRQGERDKLLLTLIYRHGLRVSEAVDLRWSDFDLETPKNRTLHVRRLKGSKDSVHTLEPDTVGMLKRLHAQTDGHYVSVRAWRTAQCRRGAAYLQAGWRTCWTAVPSASAPATARMRFLSGGGRRRHSADPVLPGPCQHFQHGDLYRDQCAALGIDQGPLNAPGVRTACGGAWHDSTARNALKHAAA